MNSAQNEEISALGKRLRPPVISALMAAALDNPRLLSLAAGFTDMATLPVQGVQTAVAALGAREGPPEHLQYGTTQGRRRLRELLASRTARLDGVQPGVFVPARTIVGNGSQQLLYLAMQVLCDPGDIVLVERPTYFVFLEMLAGLGVRAISLPTLPDGALDPGGVRWLFVQMQRSGEIKRLKAAYLMSYFANPSGVSRAAEEKAALVGALSESGLAVAIIEDAAYRDLWFEAPWPAASVFAGTEWQGFRRLYLGTLTKPFATGMKIGYAHSSDADLLDRMVWLKGHHDFGSANFNQAVLEQVLDTGGFDEHLARLRPAYARKMRRLSDALAAARLRDLGWNWSDPRGGLYLWLRAPEGVDTRIEGRFWKACLEEGVLYVPGDLCMAERDDFRHVRLSFGVLGEDELTEAAARFARAGFRFGFRAAKS